MVGFFVKCRMFSKRYDVLDSFRMQKNQSIVECIQNILKGEKLINVNVACGNS